MIHIQVQTQAIDVNQLTQTLRKVSGQVGAIATFLGVMRDMNDVNGELAQINQLTLEHYPGMTESCLQDIAVLAEKRFGLLGAVIVHRVGTFSPQDDIVFVGAASAHRQAAFEGCAYMMDYLKTQAPFWKKEHTPSGTRWVDARQTDDQAVKRWQ